MPDIILWLPQNWIWNRFQVYQTYHNLMENRGVIPDHEVLSGCEAGLRAKKRNNLWAFFDLLP